MAHSVRLRALLLLISILILAGCRKTNVVSLDREDLFSVDIGKMEDQLDLFQTVVANYKTRLAMRDGIIYISNGPSNKVMEFTSFGDLIRLFYDPEENPTPVLLQSNPAPDKVANRRAFAYPFTRVGAIAVTGDKVLLVEDLLPPERAVYDDDLGVNLNRIVLRFSSDGQLVDYLGQEGIGGSPFPYIQDIHVTGDDSIVVVSRTVEHWIVYWYAANGDLLYRADIPIQQLPVPAASAAVVPTLDSVVPDCDEELLYLKIDYYQQAVDSETGTTYGIAGVYSRVYWLDLNTGQYEGFIEIPENRQAMDSSTMFSREEVSYLYRLIGAAPGGNLFFLSRQDDDITQLLIMRRTGRVVRRRNLTIKDEEIVYKDFALSPEGILTGLLVLKDEAELVWWRSDKLLGVEP